MAFAMLGASAVSVGIARVALEASIGPARTWTRWPSSRSLPGGARPARTDEAEIGAARAPLYDTVGTWDPRISGLVPEAFTAKLVASEMAVRIADRALQTHGGHGYTRELPIERYYRDARGLLHFMTAEIDRINIARALLTA